MNAGQPDAVCTCGTADDAFVPAGHYRDCPQYETPAANQPDAERVECALPEFMGCECNHLSGCQHPAAGQPGDQQTADEAAR